MIDKRWWRKEVFSYRLPILQARMAMIAAIRGFFVHRGFLEVETPALQISPGLEPHLKAFSTILEDAWGGADRCFYLHTSPEFAMKKLLVAGLEKIFQLARVYRNGERSATHHPEFTMLEWYRAGADYTVLMEECEDLLRVALAATGRDCFVWQGRSCRADRPFERLSVPHAFEHYAQIDLLAMIDDLPAFRREAARIGISTSDIDQWDDVFFKIFLDRIEPFLGLQRPTILYDYPVSMAALSRPKAEDPRLAERFELYICGLELANAFSELTDAAEQKRRFIVDMDLKEQLYGVRYPIDADFLHALECGMKQSAGIALGIDRLAMVCTGADSIDDVLWVPVADPKE